MEIIVRLSSFEIEPALVQRCGSPEAVPAEILQDIVTGLSSQYEDEVIDCGPSPISTHEACGFLFGALEPEKFRKRISAWNIEIRQRFLSCVDSICHVTDRAGLPAADELEIDTMATYDMSCAARELDNHWFSNALHATYLPNSQGWECFGCVLSPVEQQGILENPESYAIVTVFPKG